MEKGKRGPKIPNFLLTYFMDGPLVSLSFPFDILSWNKTIVSPRFGLGPGQIIDESARAQAETRRQEGCIQSSDLFGPLRMAKSTRVFCMGKYFLFQNLAFHAILSISIF